MTSGVKLPPDVHLPSHANSFLTPFTFSIAGCRGQGLEACATRSEGNGGEEGMVWGDVLH